VLVDGSDNLGTKFLCNDAAVLARIPLVHAAAVGLWGQLLTVAPGGRPCYRCLFEALPPPDAGVGPSCAEAAQCRECWGPCRAAKPSPFCVVLRPLLDGCSNTTPARSACVRSVFGQIRTVPCAARGPRFPGWIHRPTSRRGARHDRP
jgi:hypothetical protein